MAVAYNPKIVTNGLVGYWDAANIKSYPGSGNNWIDLTSNKNTGNVINNTAYSANNKGIFSFNGSNNNVDFGNGSAINITDNLSVNIWFYLPVGYGNSGWNGIIGKRVGNSNTNYAINYNPSLNQFQWYYNTTTFRIHTLNLTTYFKADSWVNFCGIFEKNVTSTNSYIYLNGLLVSTTTLADNVSTANTNLYMGTTTVNTEFFLGKVGLLEIYNRVLTASEVKQNFNAQRGRYGI